MDGIVASLDKICDLADKYDAMVMVDECHATGFIGKTGRGTLELKEVLDRVDIVTGTLGKALGGAMGAIQQRRKKSSKFYVSVLDLIYFQILWHHPLLEPL